MKKNRDKLNRIKKIVNNTLFFDDDSDKSYELWKILNEIDPTINKNNIKYIK